MNHVVISGKIYGDIVHEYIGEISTTKFVLKNSYYAPAKSAKVITLVRCMCQGALADYVANEMYNDCSVIVTGRIAHKRWITKNTTLDMMYVVPFTISKLEQEEYV